MQHIWEEFQNKPWFGGYDVLPENILEIKLGRVLPEGNGSEKLVLRFHWPSWEWSAIRRTVEARVQGWNSDA